MSWQDAVKTQQPKGWLNTPEGQRVLEARAEAFGRMSARYFKAKKS